MIKTPTVFVLGAGASAPYGFPMGATLLNEVWRELANPSLTQFASDIIVGHPFSQTNFREFAERLRKSGRFSIDEFLQWHPDDKDLAKLAIARALAPLEDDAALDPHLRGDPSTIDRRWYRYFFDRLLTSGSGRCSLLSNNLTIVTFNFDRSFERALFQFAEANCLADGNSSATTIVQSIPVHHIHGRLGAPEWLGGAAVDQQPGEPARLYGAELGSKKTFQQCAASIRIVDDEVEHSPVLDNARGALAEADQVCFLGFSYHPLNLRKLRIEKLRGKVIRGTAFEMPLGPRRAVEKAFAGLNNEGIDLSGSEVDILDFLKNTDVLYE